MAKMHTLKLTEDEVGRLVRILERSDDPQLAATVCVQGERPMPAWVREHQAKVARRILRATQER